ncbi:DUF2238 domain-containing protein [Prevotella cerevisiae]|jgi:putative membrane protein|uniref:DUF2238 domain-containing protein n=1 Tax=Segatella cerevisiae TaxID=2053716 RepID=A0ABT1BU83_9BACT|nr:DUF2238 domain-containing protein [Segatella cerevisiae]MCO6024651.1 DUF2238 domain-containing protein [Segatella cerevisiae]
MKLRLCIIILLIVIALVSLIHPPYLQDQLLQHLGTVVLLVPLVLDVRRQKLPVSAFIGIALFILLHIIGARYIYSNVPYESCFKSWFHIDVNGILHTTRNDYDRFVHLGFGIFFYPFFYFMSLKYVTRKYLPALFTAWLMIQTGSMLYELFEGLITCVMSPQAADDYNGQQGDMWDSQKDMAMALLGSTVMYVAYLLRRFYGKVQSR